jgi:anti-sigma regulatory factor (Ser/Thr protein kinase)
MRFTVTDLPRLRSRVGGTASLAGLDEQRCEELVLAAYELASNAIRHGGGGGDLRLSRENGCLRCQVSDDGPGFDGAADSSGRGLLLVRELVDDMEINSGAGAVVTLTVHCRTPSELVD